jgi:galactokinase
MCRIYPLCVTEAMFFAPGRVNLIGEHLDYNGGRCLPIALSVGATVTVRRAPTTTFESRQLSGGSWTSYAAGVLRALALEGIEVPPISLTVDSTVPIGSGLSSSAALTCAVGMAALWAAEVPLDPDLVIPAAMHAEAEAAGAPTGGLDQTASMLCRAGHALLLDFATGARRQVPWRHTLLVVDTRVRRALNDGRYAERRAECEEAARALGVRRLASATSWEGLEGVLAKRARHVVTEMLRVDQVLAGDIGPAFTASHESLRDDFEVSCPELDVVVEAALDGGAHGARMTGGGFGGSAIALVDNDRVDEVRACVASAFGRRGWPAPGFLDGTASSGALQLARGS